MFRLAHRNAALPLPDFLEGESDDAFLDVSTYPPVLITEPHPNLQYRQTLGEVGLWAAEMEKAAAEAEKELDDMTKKLDEVAKENMRLKVKMRAAGILDE
jgi:hypothetical protein